MKGYKNIKEIRGREKREEVKVYKRRKKGNGKRENAKDYKNGEAVKKLKDIYYKKNEVVKGYTIIKIIGAGRYGIAYLAKGENGKLVVIKQLKNEMLERSRSKLFYEKSIMKALDSPCFPKYIGSFKDEYREGYIMEYIEGKVFEDILARENYRFNREEIYKIAGQIIDFIEILQQNNIVHRDIRMPNVIVKENADLVLIDFGLARFIDGDKYEKDVDYWYLADFLIHLYYSFYKGNDEDEKPWNEELDLTKNEKIFLEKLMGINDSYDDIKDIRKQLDIIKNENK